MTLTKGTFARVCLVRLASPKNEAERSRVFALKILRKTEGSCNKVPILAASL